MPKVASPVSTGGGGSDYERRVGAYYLATALLRSVPRGQEAGQAREVRFQRLYQGEPLDDLVIVSDLPAGESKLALQIKRDLSFGEDNQVFDEVIRACWETFNSSSFNLGIDRFGIVVALYSKNIDEYYQSVLTWARTSASAVDFLERVAKEKLSNKTQRSFVRRIRLKLDSYRGSSVNDEKLWGFLRSMVILHFDFQREGSREYTYAVESVSHLLAPDRRGESPQLFTKLVEYASEANRTAGSFNSKILRQRLQADGFSLLPSPDCYSDSIEPSGARANLADVDERYRAWLKEKTAHLKVPGLGLSEELSIETNWIPLRAKLREDSNESFDAEFVAELYRLSIVTGTPGTGKSTLMNRLAHRLSASGKRVLLVRLPEVQKLWRKQGGFEDAILKASADNSGLSEEKLRLALSAPDYLLADGLDECNSDRANIAKELDSWVKAPSRRSITRVIVTTRIGHEPGLLPGWKHIEISPLDQSRDRWSIQKYAKELLNAFPGEEAELEKRLALLENQLQTNKNASLAARNPLLLGFLVQLIAKGKSIKQNRAELYRDIIKLAYERPPLDREPIELKKREKQDAKRILEIAGWKLLQEPELSADELIESLIEELETRDYTLREAEEKAEAGVDFWENRCIFERRRVGNQDLITFIHPTLGEYAAGRYASRLDDEKRGEWLEEVRRDSRWREPILLAAGLGAGETIVKNLLEFNNSEEPSSEDAILTAFVLAEMIDPPSNLLEVVANRIRLQVESHIPHIAFKAADAMLELAKLAPDFIGSIAKSLLKSSNSWTRLAATGLALVCGEDYVDLDILKEVLDDIVTEPVHSPVLFKLPFITSPKLSNKSKEYGEYGWAFQNQVLLDGCQLLLQKQPGLETARKIEQAISQGTLSSGTNSSLRQLLIPYIFENIKSREQQENREEWKLILQALIRPDNLFAESSLQKLLETLKQKKRTINADRAILEAILRVTDSTSESLLPEHQLQKPVALAILLRGMGWSRLRHCYWSLMNENSNLDAVDAVFTGAIAAMEIDSQTLSTEASLALEHIQQYDLEAIDSVLLNEGNSTEEWSWEQIEKLYKTDEDPFKWSICSEQIPEVPREPKWELAQKLGLSARELVRALKHPSPVIVANAAQLLVHNAGGIEAVPLVRELLREETGLALKLRDSLEYWVQQGLE